jgi:hypothetical protein
LTDRTSRALLASLAACMLSTVSLAQAMRTPGSPGPIGELILLSPDQSDRLVILFEDNRALLTESSRIRLKEFSEHLRHSKNDVRRVLVVGTTVPTGDSAADQDLAIRRGVTARDELIRLSGLDPSLFLVQASRSMSSWKSTGRVIIEFNGQSSPAPRGLAQVRTAWDTAAQRWLLVCADGSVLPARMSAPDDFSAAHQCRNRAEHTAPVRITAGAVARWESETARWVLRCPDGSPLIGQMRDPDDFHAMARCRN